MFFVRNSDEVVLRLRDLIVTNNEVENGYFSQS